MLGSPNILANIALFLWAPAVLYLYWRLPTAKATCIAFLGGALFLPELVTFDMPVVPPMNKLTVTSLWALVAALLFARHRRRLQRARPFRGADLFFVLIVLSSVGTVLTNSDELVTGPVTRPPLTSYDVLAGGVRDLLGAFLPFFFARAAIRSRKELQFFVRIMVVLGLVYTVGALIEVRLSPQLHNWTYGYHPAHFGMTKRAGGYRPTLYLAHGLAVGMFFVAAGTLATARARAGLGRPWTAAWIWAVLLLCKSAAAAVYGLFTAPFVAFVRRPKMVVPMALGALIILFPLLRGTDVFPTDTLVELAKDYINEERALSLGFRFDQEDELLERARERLWFGWGSYQRNRVLDERTGKDLSVTDGEWMIVLGQRGIFGFIGYFGLILWPLVMARRKIQKLPDMDRILLSGLGVAVAVTAVDLLPNGLFNYLPFFYAGALAGAAEGLRGATGRRWRTPAGAHR